MWGGLISYPDARGELHWCGTEQAIARCSLSPQNATQVSGAGCRVPREQTEYHGRKGGETKYAARTGTDGDKRIVEIELKSWCVFNSVAYSKFNDISDRFDTRE